MNRLFAFGFCAAIVSLRAPAEILVEAAAPESPATIILEQQPIQPGQAYILTWHMVVEGEKSWRFRAPFSGLEVTIYDRSGNAIRKLRRHTSCWQTLGRQAGWFRFEAPIEAAAVRADMRIESPEALNGRYRIEDVRLRSAERASIAVQSGGSSAVSTGWGVLHVVVRDEGGGPSPARIYVLDEDGKGHAPPYAFVYTQGTTCFHLERPGPAEVTVPVGRYTVRAMRGFEHEIVEGSAEIADGATARVELTLRRRVDLREKGWHSGDHHTHLFRHGGSVYPMMNLNDVWTVAKGEGLDFLPFMGVDTSPELNRPIVEPEFIGGVTDELTRDFWGHVCPIVPEQIRIGAGYGDALPMNADIIRELRRNGGAVAYAHPYGPVRRGSEYACLETPRSGLVAREFPIDVALGLPCTLDLLTKEDAGGDFELKLRDYMRLLNLGFRVGVSGSTDFHLEQGREPIGGLRTYVRMPKLTWANVARAYNEGRTFATNGPLLLLEAEGKTIGDTLTLQEPGTVTCTIEADSLWGLTRVRLWRDGAVVRDIPARGAVQERIQVRIERSGWMLATAEGPPAREVMHSPEGKPLVKGQFAITSPIYVDVKGRPAARDPEAASYFAGWVEAVGRGFEVLCVEMAGGGEPVPDEERRHVRRELDRARQVFQGMALR